MSILLTGGAGYIGSHTAVELLNKDKDIIIVDNFSNSSKIVLDRIRDITSKNIKYYDIDLINKEELELVFLENNIESVIHFAGYKSVGESVKKPLYYYNNNLGSTLNLLELMDKHNVKNMVFSSSATVYGNPNKLPIKEDFPLSTINPYGTTKLMIENILKDISKSDNGLNIVILRYFNPVGAHKSGLIGDDPNGIPNNLMPYIAQVAIGNIDKLKVFGSDYNTHDGTGVRDYIHVVDLAKGHIKALEKLNTNCGLLIYNLGTGKGYSVLDMVNTFSSVSGKEIKYEIVERRLGDISTCYADCSKANEELNWKAEYGIREMCIDTWNWQINNPKGYK